MASPTLVIAFCDADRWRVEALGPWMRSLSRGHQIGERLIFCAKTSAEIPSAAFDGLFGTMETMRVLDGPTGWPRGCNHQFLDLAKAIDSREDISSFYYFEPDCLPMREDWWRKICMEYASCGKPFWGMEQPNVEGDKINGTHMVGTGIYPRDAWSRIKVYAEIDREQPDRPWDVLHREEVNPQCFFTKLAIHCAGMTNYTPDGFASYPKHFQGAARYSLDIPKDTCVFHGCKDTSLMDAMGARLGITGKRHR